MPPTGERSAPLTQWWNPELLPHPPRPLSHVSKTKAYYSYFSAHAAYRGEVRPSNPVVEPWAPPPPSRPLSHVARLRLNNYSYFSAHAAYRGEVCPSDPVVEPWAPPLPFLPLSHVSKTEVNWSYLFAHVAYRGEVHPSDPVVETWAPPPPSPPTQPHQQNVSGTHQGDKKFANMSGSFSSLFFKSQDAGTSFCSILSLVHYFW